MTTEFENNNFTINGENFNNTNNANKTKDSFTTWLIVYTVCFCVGFIASLIYSFSKNPDDFQLPYLFFTLTKGILEVIVLFFLGKKESCFKYSAIFLIINIIFTDIFIIFFTLKDDLLNSINFDLLNIILKARDRVNIVASLGTICLVCFGLSNAVAFENRFLHSAWKIIAAIAAFMPIGYRILNFLINKNASLPNVANNLLTAYNILSWADIIVTAVQIFLFVKTIYVLRKSTNF